YHPTFLYESFWNILVLILLLVIRRKNLIRGEVFLTYLISYSVGRFFIEGMRTDSLYGGGLRAAQVISILLIVGSIMLIIYWSKSKKKTRYYDGTKLDPNLKNKQKKNK